MSVKLNKPEKFAQNILQKIVLHFFQLHLQPVTNPHIQS